MDRIRELLERLSTLTSEELTELRSLISEEFARLDGEDATAEIVAAQNELADAADQVMAQEAEREAQKAQAETDRAAARERVAKLNGDTDDESDSDVPEAADTTVDPEAAGDEPAVAAVAEPAEVVTAAGKPRAKRGLTGIKGTPSPERGGQRQGAVLTASGALREIAGQDLTDRETLARSMGELLSRMPKNGAPRGDVLVASANFRYPEERILGTDAWENSRKMEAARDALVATGGIAAPTNVDYNLGTWATADRPVRDGLLGFQATRGGLLFVQPPTLASLSSATGIWTEATDANPGAATKPVQNIAPGSTTQVYVDAVATRVGFGNMFSRFAPEQIAANTDLAIAYAARVAENNLLNKIAAASISVTTSQYLGASRDLLATLMQSMAGFRSAHRIPRSQTFTAILPDYLKDEMRIDILNEIGHGQTTELNVFDITEEQVDQYLQNLGLNVIWHIDGQPLQSSGTTYPAQLFPAQSAGALQAFPDKIVMYLFIDGTVQFLDGGRLDLGVVRDSTLDATNDYETFVETFEGIANRGFTGGVWQLVSKLIPNGASTGTVTPTAWA